MFVWAQYVFWSLLRGAQALDLQAPETSFFHSTHTLILQDSNQEVVRYSHFSKLRADGCFY
jgi:hypothetical protein